ncbi:MAG: hypothetical protein JNM85_06770 [Chthonomonas sp.]|nr:hypothetical protein [Chthonomonas sp.]
MRKNSNVLKMLAAVLFVGQGLIHNYVVQPRWAKDYAPKQTGIAEGLSPDQLLAALAGFREMIAGILWVRADSFFDTGNYDAILPIVRLVTWLDPSQIDVYATGMWHIGYNFTDEEQRSDRRYLPSALALGMEGAKNNPATYEMYFETGWMWYHKIEDDFDQSVNWFEQAGTKQDMLPARRNVLANAYMKAGKIDRALDYYYSLLDKAELALKNDKDNFQNRTNRDTIENNIDTMLVRMSQRGWFTRNNPAENPIPADTQPPFETGFSVRATVVEAKVIQFEGTWNVLPVGTRIRAILRDEDYPNAYPGSVHWEKDATTVNLDPPRDRTFMQEQLYVRNRQFLKKVDMSKDPTMYPMSRDKYVLEFYYSARNAPPHIQDKFGWNGEGFTDKNFLNLDARPGVRVMYTSFTMTRDQLLRRGEWAEKTPVIQTPNFVELNRSNLNKDIINVPGLLSEPSVVKPGN